MFINLTRRYFLNNVHSFTLSFGVLVSIFALLIFFNKYSNNILNNFTIFYTAALFFGGIYFILLGLKIPVLGWFFKLYVKFDGNSFQCKTSVFSKKVNLLWKDIISKQIEKKTIIFSTTNGQNQKADLSLLTNDEFEALNEWVDTLLKQSKEK